MGKRSREKREKFLQQNLREEKDKPQTDLEKICLFIIHCATYLALLTPLIVGNKFYFPFVAPKSLYFMGLAEIIFFSWLILIIHFPQYRPRFNSLLVALILFLVILIFSTLYSENPSYSFWSKPERMTGLLMMLHLFGFFLVISSTFAKKEDWEKIFIISISVGLILSFIALDSKDSSMRGGATIGNESFWGSYLIFTLFFALYLIFTAKTEIKIYSVISFLIIFLVLFFSEARAAKISFLGGLALLLFLYLAFESRKKYLQILGRGLLIFSFLIFLVFSFLLFQEGSFINKKFVELASKSRLVIWEKAWRGFLERPFLGWGPENFEYPFAKYFNPCLFLPECGGEIWFDRAHNIIFDTLVTTGIFGLLTYLGIFLSVFYLLTKNYFQKKIDFRLAGIFLVLLISYFVQNLTVFDMISSYLMFFLVLGFIANQTTFKEISLSPKFISFDIFSFFIVFVLFLFSFFYFIIQPLKTDYYVIAAINSPPASKERLDFYKKTLEASPLGKYQIREFFGQNILAFAQSGKIKEVSLENFKKEIDFVIEELEKSIKEAPLDFRSHLTLGQLYNVYAVFINQTKISDAERVLTKAIEISPTNQQGYWALAQIRFHQGKFEEAISLAEKAVELEPKVFRSHQIVVQIAKIVGNENLIQEKIQRAIQINPQWKELLPYP